MFDLNMRQVGARISRLRKQQNMTQMELADRLGISFQAVSNWERGASMPDIAKLPELAALFDVSVDALIGTEGKETALVRRTEEGAQDVHLDLMTAEELKKAAPVLKPEQVSAAFRQLGPRKLEDIAGWLPFLDNALVNELGLRAAEQGDWKVLGAAVPFMDEDVIDGLWQKAAAEERDLRMLGLLAPFMSTDSVDEIAAGLYHNCDMEAMCTLLPFMSEDKLREIAQEEYQENGLRRFACIAPFLGEDYLNELAREILEKEGIKALIPIAPFLDEKMISEYVRREYL